MRLIVPVRLGGLAASPFHLKAGRISSCRRELVYWERVEDVTLCTRTGHSGQDESLQTNRFVRYLIGKMPCQTLPTRRTG